MRLEPLYRLRFHYPESWRARDQRFLIAEGSCDGRIAGRFRGANRALRRDGGGYVPDLSGAIETEDGATILVRLGGYGWPEAGRVVAWATHVAEDERYTWLNDLVGVIAGDVRDREVRLEVAELVWEPPAE